ncbi:MAG TPA: ATP-binding protein [Chitinophagaceae bacterium]|nr:ATP-binding protein [Chitinophagaceae bacterium]
MDRFFRQLPFAVKLLMIAIFPLVLIVYLTVGLYREKNEKLGLINSYIDRIKQSEGITRLIDDLQEERKFTFDFAMTKAKHAELLKQRPVTDAAVQRLLQMNDPGLVGFLTYTNLEKLAEVRGKVDSTGLGPNEVMHYYSNMIFRLNTLNSVPASANNYLTGLNKELAAQKILTEMITYLGIIRSNIYNVLYTRKYMVETLIGTMGTHDVYNSYEKEFEVKAPTEVINEYRRIRRESDLRETDTYIDSLFKKFSFDSTYTADTWWAVSNNGVNELRKLQGGIWEKVNSELGRYYAREKREQNKAVFFLLLTIVLLTAFLGYTIHVITKSVEDLRNAAGKISMGYTGLEVSVPSKDVIGDLARSISAIDQTNKRLAEAAIAIGHGDFTVPVIPRSEKDLLSNAIADMKCELQNYREKMELLVDQRTEALHRSNEDLQQFAHVASHDLKEPLRKIRSFSSLLNEQNGNQLTGQAKVYLNKIEKASERMSNMVEGVLKYSIVNSNQQAFEPIHLDEVIRGVESDLEMVIQQKNAVVQYASLPWIHGIPVLIHQLFYNLLNNALKFSTEGRHPVIKITHRNASVDELAQLEEADGTEDYIAIDVADNGIGFHPDYATQMFQVFTRLNSKESYEGTGLGLALCKKIAERHNGFIYATGIEGKGSTFTIILPSGEMLIP